MSVFVARNCRARMLLLRRQFEGERTRPNEAERRMLTEGDTCLCSAVR